MPPRRRLSRSYKRRIRRRALLVTALVILTILLLGKSLQWPVERNASGTSAMMPDSGG